MADLPEAIASREGRLLAESIIGLTDPHEIVASLGAFCEARLGSGLSGIFLCELSVGAAFGLQLGSGARIFLKVHPPERPAEYLRAVHEVQGYLYRRAFPCPRPVAGPAPFGHSLATVDEFVDRGEYADAHEPEIRRAMARTLARLVELAGEFSGARALSLGWNWPQTGLWTTPHNALFDFEASTSGAGWIDEIAGEAKRIVDAFHGNIVVGHTDWSVDQMRFEGGAVCVVYDWDSIRLDKEVVIVGIAAGNFSGSWRLGIPNPPSPGETKLFAEEYEAARAARFSTRERSAIAAAATYAIAYIARCEHALDPAGDDMPGSFREALSLHAAEYLRT